MEDIVLTPSERQHVKNEIISLMNVGTVIFLYSVTHADEHIRRQFSARLDWLRLRSFQILDNTVNYNTSYRQIHMQVLMNRVLQLIDDMKNMADNRVVVERMNSTLRTNRQ